jgi:hypothetical protein
MLYMRLLKLKKDTQSITNLEATDRYLRSLEGIQRSMRRFCNEFFVEFGDLYTLLDVYNISEKLELAHAHYEARFMSLHHVQGLSFH